MCIDTVFRHPAASAYVADYVAVSLNVQDAECVYELSIYKFSKFPPTSQMPSLSTSPKMADITVI